MNSFKELVLDMMLALISYFDSYVGKAQAMLTTNLFSGETYNAMMQIAEYLTPICVTIIAICFSIDLVTTIIKTEMFKWQFGAKILFKFLAARCAFAIAPKLFATIYATVAYWIVRVFGNSSGTGMGREAEIMLRGLFEDMSFWSTLGLVATLIILFIVITVSGLMIYAMAFARAFQLYIYIAISPLPCAFLPMEDHGLRIVKKFVFGFAAVCLQGLMMIIAMQIFDSIIGNTIVDAIANTSATGAAGVSAICFNMLLGSIVLLMAVAQSGSWAKQILDAA